MLYWPGRTDRSWRTSRICRCSIDADYSPQYVKLARVLRDKIESGQYRRGDSMPAAELAGQYKVSVRVTCNALAMLAANRYLSRPGPFSSYNIIWQGGA